MSCGVVFYKKGDVGAVTRSYDYSNSNLKKFCQICGKGFNKKKGRVLDEQVYYNEKGLRIYACTKCDKVIK